MFSFFFFQTGSFKIIGISSQETCPFESVEVGACAQPVASACLDSSQTYNDFGWRVGSPFNNGLNYCNFSTPSVETTRRQILK